MVHPFVPVVGHKAERNARVARLRQPEPYVTRHFVGVTREDGVVHVQQHVAKAQRQQVAVDIDARDARKVAVGFEKSHGVVANGLGERLLMLFVRFAEVVLHRTAFIRREVEEEVVRLRRVAHGLQAIETRRADGRGRQTRVRVGVERCWILDILGGGS